MTTLDVVRASTFVAEVSGKLQEAPKVTVPVVGGHSGVTIVPLLSQSSLPVDASEELIKRIQFGGDEVVKAKDGAGSATLSMAYAGAEFANLVIKAIKGESGIVAPTYVSLDVAGGAELKKELGTEVAYFSAPVEISVRILYYIPQTMMNAESRLCSI